MCDEWALGGRERFPRLAKTSVRFGKPRILVEYGRAQLSKYRCDTLKLCTSSIIFNYGQLAGIAS